MQEERRSTGWMDGWMRNERMKIEKVNKNTNECKTLSRTNWLSSVFQCPCRLGFEDADGFDLDENLELRFPNSQSGSEIKGSPRFWWSTGQ